jgi:orotate phosphoribosyltransferase
MNIANEIARKLLKINAIKLSPQKPYTWASGWKSPIYCDNRIALSYPAIRQSIIQSFVEKAEQFEPYDAIAGVATAGIAHGVLLASELDKPFAYVRPKAKGHGRQNQIEGELLPGSKVLVIEDLISTGGSCLKAVEALRASGVEVVGVLAIFTYGFERATEAFKAVDCPFTTLSEYDVLIQTALQEGYINSAVLQSLQEWRQNPDSWGNKFI